MLFCDLAHHFYIECRKYGLDTDYNGGYDMAEKFFLGGVTPSGFSTQLTELVCSRQYFTYILKGGAGTGKSSLMKKLADRFEQTENVTRYYCSSDPDSLDAVVLHSSKAVIVDGTAPHVFDPKYPGVCQKIVDLGFYWNDAMLKADREKIIAACRLNKSLMSSAANCNKALGNICTDIYSCAGEFLDEHKLESFAERFCRKLFGRSRGNRGKQSIRQLSVMTRFGYMTLSETLENYLDIYLLDDSFFAASDAFIRIAAKQAQSRGYDVKLSPCLLFDGTVFEHLLIDEIGVAFVSADPLTRLSCKNAAKINMSRFYDKAKMQPHKKRLKTDSTLAAALINSSREMLDSAKLVHDEIESYYIKAMDFDALDRVCEDIAAQILAK